MKGGTVERAHRSVKRHVWNLTDRAAMARDARLEVARSEAPRVEFRAETEYEMLENPALPST